MYLNLKVAYKELTEYIPFYPGNYDITVFPSGQITNLVTNTKMYIPENTVFNVAALGNLSNIILYTIPEPMEAVI
jgi:hypothetical protein